MAGAIQVQNRQETPVKVELDTLVSFGIRTQHLLSGLTTRSACDLLLLDVKSSYLVIVHFLNVKIFNDSF